MEKGISNVDTVRQNEELVNEIISLNKGENLDFKLRTKNRKGDRKLHSILDTLVKYAKSTNKKSKYSFVNIRNQFGRITHLRLMRIA